MIDYKYNLKGGSLKSVMVDGTERQYQPMEGSWSGQDVVIFPFVARLKDGKYTHDGKEYEMKNHGLARYNNFNIVNKTYDSDTIVFKSNEETLKQYPYPFELRVNYRKENNTLFVSYTVKNTGSSVMPFGIGAHPAMKVSYLDSDTKGNFLCFGKEDTYDLITLDETGSFVTKEEKITLPDEIEVNKDFFKKYKTFIIRCNNLDSVTLRRKDGKKIIYHFHSTYLALWSHPDCGDYVCVEPWDSLPDFVNGDSEIMNKKTLIHLDPGKEYHFNYSMEYIDE